MGNAYLKLAGAVNEEYDFSIENQLQSKLNMATQLTSKKPHPDLGKSTLAEASACAKIGLWQRMVAAWIATYELSAKSGTVPFLLL